MGSSEPGFLPQGEEHDRGEALLHQAARLLIVPVRLVDVLVLEHLAAHFAAALVADAAAVGVVHVMQVES
ncbi:hypothetical protein [Arthrobacter sp. RAF14]|uniref:hypothetical protein n=1 Tax=Arthrobacter sp. RAF14 TaxID=3233051 RepID=UPI003F92D841